MEPVIPVKTTVLSYLSAVSRLCLCVSADTIQHVFIILISFFYRHCFLHLPLPEVHLQNRPLAAERVWLLCRNGGGGQKEGETRSDCRDEWCW